MTDTATHQDDGLAEPSHDTITPQDTGGSPLLGENDRVVGADGKPYVEPGTEPEPAKPDEGADLNAQRVAELERELARREQKLSEYDTVLADIQREMDNDPALNARLTQGKTLPPQDAFAHFKETVEKGIEGPAAEQLLRAVAPMFEELNDLRQMVGNNGNKLQRVERSVGSAEFRGALSNQGVNRETQGSQAWDKFLRDLRGDREFQRAEARNPQFAAKHAAAMWKSAEALRAGFADDRQRLRSARVGQDSTGAQRGSSAAEKVHVLKRDGSHVDRATRIRLKDPQAIIRYED